MMSSKVAWATGVRPNTIMRQKHDLDLIDERSYARVAVKQTFDQSVFASTDRVRITNNTFCIGWFITSGPFPLGK